MRRRTKGLVALLAAALMGVGLFTTTALGGSPADPWGGSLPDHAKAPKRVLPSDPEDRLVMGVWRNCAFHIIKLRVTEVEFTSPDGSKTVATEAGSAPEEVAAQLPPQDPKCDRVPPTQAQIDKMKADVGAEQKAIRDKVQAKKGGATTAQTLPPAVPLPPP